ncbi:MAG TPA: methionine adenosyltransferase [Anaerohalosphaeraceae bacterium]|nr:methionine adenosyltransferase [Phycisphaerae bacterium]HOK95747.1 methionine adenosyltransferase [Anaerohalosphaeraceae bacterium]HOL32286.1 methionine adenosyltransferase [Anaerohalosphaeraceae bacterium]HOM77119.1 methionine adenosyltransferase [Anaerohalosphaeraceae bacterium]HPC64297.1 methionine adenosyltransferase [Anaerohalosphaeraceae bacterium]
MTAINIRPGRFNGRGHLFTSESVTMGHPDKVADQISDAVLDAALQEDPDSRVACETMVTTGLVIVAGEITTKAYLDIPAIVRQTIYEIGYTDAAIGFDWENCAILNSIGRQSPDISQGVTEGQGLHKEQGAGDQGLMFGFACRETPALMPMPIYLAHKITDRLAVLRKSRKIPWLRPDGKSQVTVEYDCKGKPKRIHTVVVSAQHTEEVKYSTIRKNIIEQVILPVLPPKLVDKNIIYHINPTGRFVNGGPKADCGLTGRKIIVDTYGGRGCHGGGAFSGKDPTKVDRSASYMARYIAKNIVAAGLADACELQLSYAIGVADPVSVLVDTEGTAKVDEAVIERLVRELFPLTPKGIINHLKLKRPIYKETARNGHFGRSHPDFTWEKTDMVQKLRKAAGLKS